MHTNQKTACTVKLFVPLINIITGKIIDLFCNKIPTTDIKIADAKVHTLYSNGFNKSLKTFCKLYGDIVVYSGHKLLVYVLNAYNFTNLINYILKSLI